MSEILYKDSKQLTNTNKNAFISCFLERFDGKSIFAQTFTKLNLQQMQINFLFSIFKEKF